MPTAARKDSPSDQAEAFEVACRAAVGRLRSSILGLMRALDADPTRPQELARRFKLDKSLTWKVSRALRSADVLSAAADLPGASGLAILLEAMRRGGAPSELVEEARRASDEYEKVIEVHTGDRETMRLILDGHSRDDRSHEASRRQAFRGNSGIWGIQCGVRVSAQFLAPSTDDPAALDFATLAGATRVRRLRPLPSWPILDIGEHRDDGSPRFGAATRVPLGAPDDDGGWILRPFCSDSMPPVVRRIVHGRVRFEIGDGPVGRTGEFDWFGGHLQRASVPRFASGGDSFGQLEVGISAPAEALLFDLFVHRELSEARELDLLHFGRLPRDVDRSDPSQELPISTPVHDLGRSPSIVTPLVDRYDELIDAVMTHVGWSLDAFHCFRVVYRYPPLLSTVGMRYALPAPPVA